MGYCRCGLLTLNLGAVKKLTFAFYEGDKTLANSILLIIWRKNI